MGSSCCSAAESSGGHVVVDTSTAERTWTVTVHKKGDIKLGLDVDLVDGTSLCVDKVNPGLIDDWNKEHPNQAVQVNDLIIRVNSKEKHAWTLSEECKHASTLVMHMVRPSA